MTSRERGPINFEKTADFSLTEKERREMLEGELDLPSITHLTSREEAENLGLEIADAMSPKERELLRLGVERTLEYLQDHPDIQTIFFLDATVRPAAALLRAGAKAYGITLPKSYYLPVGSEMQHLEEKMKDSFVEQLRQQFSKELSSPSIIIDEYVQSGRAITFAEEIVRKASTSEVHAFGMTDAYIGNGFFSKDSSKNPERPKSTNDGGMQWENLDIRLRFPVDRDINTDKTIRIDVASMRHTTPQLEELASAALRENTQQKVEELLKAKAEQLAFDRVCYNAYVEQLCKNIFPDS